MNLPEEMLYAHNVSVDRTEDSMFTDNTLDPIAIQKKSNMVDEAGQYLPDESVEVPRLLSGKHSSDGETTDRRGDITERSDNDPRISAKRSSAHTSGVTGLIKDTQTEVSSVTLRTQSQN